MQKLYKFGAKPTYQQSHLHISSYSSPKLNEKRNIIQPFLHEKNFSEIKELNNHVNQLKATLIQEHNYK